MARRGFGGVVTWRVGAVRRFGQALGHALQWKIKSAAALLRSAAGLPLSRATIRLIDLPAC